MTPHNYSPRAIADLMQRAEECDAMGASEGARVNRIVAGLVDRATKYILPPQGKLFDAEMDRSGFVEFLKPADEVLLGEYSCKKHHEGSKLEVRESEERIALVTRDFEFLARSWEMVTGSPFSQLSLAARDAFCVVPIYSLEPTPSSPGVPFSLPLCAVLLKPSETRVPPAEAARQFLGNEYLEDFARHRGLNPNNPNHGLLRKQLVPLTPEFMQTLAAKGHTHDELYALATIDSNDEEQSATDLVIALACANTEHRLIDAPERLNRKRLKNGKQPLYGYRIIGPRGHLDGPRASPKAHLRSGHIRRIGPNRITWVRPALVNA